MRTGIIGIIYGCASFLCLILVPIGVLVFSTALLDAVSVVVLGATSIWCGLRAYRLLARRSFLR